MTRLPIQINLMSTQDAETAVGSVNRPVRMGRETGEKVRTYSQDAVIQSARLSDRSASRTSRVSRLSPQTCNKLAFLPLSGRQAMIIRVSRPPVKEIPISDFDSK